MGALSDAPAKSPLLQKMCERCIERDKDLPECRERRYFCDFYICSEQPKKRRAQEEVTDEKISVEVNKLIRKGNSKNTSMIMVASRFGLGMAVIRSRYARFETTKKKTKGRTAKKQTAATKTKATVRKKTTARRATAAATTKKTAKKAVKKKPASTGRLQPPAKKTAQKTAKKKAVKKKTAARKKK